MAYWLELDQDRVVRYFREMEGLSRAARLAVVAGLQRYLSERGDMYRNNPDLRLSPGSHCFQIEIGVQDSSRLRAFRFIVNDSGAAAGVLRVVYVDEPLHFRPPGN
jgi:hypothetical protein